MLDELRTFLDVALLGNLSKVAISRDIAVSSVSRKIDALEADLGIKLFHRSSRAIILTDAGEQFLPRARSIVAELDDAKDAIADLRADPRGLLSVTAPASFGQRIVTPAVASFLNKYPLMEIELFLSDQVVDLSTQRVDVAVRIGTLPDSDLVATRLAPVRRLACASPDYIRRHGLPQRPEELSLHNCLTTTSRPRLSNLWCFPGVNQGKPVPIKGTFRSDDLEALLKASVAGIGVVHLASFLVSELIVAGKLVRLFDPASATPAKNAPAVHAVRLPGRSHATKAQLFIAHLRSEFGEPAYWDRVLDSVK